MISPYEHEKNFDNLAVDTQVEMMNLMSQSMKVLRKVLNADGFNFGANFGEVAGAGIKEHLHLHLVPRWIGDTNFMAILTIKIGSRVMLIFNIDTIDGLVNGELGHVIGIEKKDDYVQFIIVKFDDENCGARHRKKFPGLSAKYAAQNGTPIGRHEFDYVYGKKEFKHAAKKKIKQFPLRLSWAITCHKMQGQTIKTGSKLVVHWHTKLQDGMAYVM